jgi:hypothetical protein
MVAPETERASDQRAERVLLTRARRGELEALGGLVHRYASLVWAACAQVTADETAAATRFAECWDAVLDSLGTARRSPDLAMSILEVCRERLAETAPEEAVERAIASAHQLASESSAFLEAPPAALRPVTDRLAEHGERLRRETADRRASRQRSIILPSALGLALLVGAVAAVIGASHPSTEDFLARCLRNRVVASDLVPRYRDIVAPPFEVAERQPAEARQYEEVGLVLEELANMPRDARAEQAARIQRRAQALDLIDFCANEAEKQRGANRTVMEEVCLVLEELASL